MDLSLLPEGSDSKSLYVGWEGSATIFLARLGVLQAYRSCREGRLQPITFSTKLMTRCSQPLSLAVAAAYQMVMEEQKYTINELSWLSFCCRKYFLCCAFLMRELMFGSRMKACEIMVARKGKDLTASTRQSIQTSSMADACWSSLFIKSIVLSRLHPHLSYSPSSCLTPYPSDKGTKFPKN